MPQKCCVLFILLLAKPALADIVIDDFDDVTDWSGLTISSALVQQGSGSGRWQNHAEQTSVSKTFTAPIDASSADTVSFWLHSSSATGAQIELIFDSENAASEGWDYYRSRIVVDWQGWRHLWIPLEDFAVARQPTGWNQLNYVRLSASGWGHEPVAGTDLHLDDLRLVQALVDDVTYGAQYIDNDYVLTYHIAISEKMNTPLTIDSQVVLAADSAWSVEVTPTQTDLVGLATAEITVKLTIAQTQIQPSSYLQTESTLLSLSVAGLEREVVPLQAVIPLPARAAPRLLLNAADFARINSWASTHSWADSQRSSIIASADAWPQNHNDKYGLVSWSVAPEGQWAHWYVCPNHGVRLQYSGPGQNICPVDSANYAGWPYDEVIYTYRHNDSSKAAKNLGLAYQLTGDVSYALAAAEILLAYADIYRSYQIHNNQGVASASGARVLSQTLSEAVWLIPMAWAYDLIADSGQLSPADHQHIVEDLLLPAVAVIDNHDAGKSNWQSWHNAAFAAVGFATQDPRLQSMAIHGPSGFWFQMVNSVSADGFWYEGAWSYHFYALTPLYQTAIMAELAGLDLFGSDELRSMFTAPVAFAMPDQRLPPFNDSGSVNLLSSAGYYEVATARYPDPQLVMPLAGQSRRQEALFWGLQELPSADSVQQGSLIFSDAGYVVFRAGAGSTDHYLALDYGPHGGGHGHLDKLSFVSFALGGIQAVDPGTQLYAAPTHATWDKKTVAHNTVVIDQQDQQQATGTLLRAQLLPDIGFARASAGDVYPGVATLERQMAVTGDYAIDLFQVTALDGGAHQVDLVYHNYGNASANVNTSPYSAFPGDNGYQHLSNAVAHTGGGELSVLFAQGSIEGQAYGSVWANSSDIQGSYTMTQQQVSTGLAAARLHYDFSLAQGYLLFSSETPQPETRIPSALRVDVHGSSSGHGLRFRLMDATGERFVYNAGDISWNGWQTVRADNPEGWSHYLGNDDGVIDTPISSVVVGIHSSATGPVTGDIYIDNPVLEYGADELLVEDFERPVRNLTWQVLAEPDTTLVLGEGLGPDLTKPVPFAMVRRHSAATDFVSLYEPHGQNRVVSDFAKIAVDSPNTDQAHAFALSSADWLDWLLMVGQGAAGTERTAGDNSCDGTLCYIRRGVGGGLLALALAEGSQINDSSGSLLQAAHTVAGLVLQIEGTTLVLKGDYSSAQLRVRAANIDAVIDDAGDPLPWQRQGDEVVVFPNTADAGGFVDGSVENDALVVIADSGQPDATATDRQAVDATEFESDTALADTTATDITTATDTGTDSGPVEDTLTADGAGKEKAPNVGQGCGCTSHKANGAPLWITLFLSGGFLLRHRIKRN